LGAEWWPELMKPCDSLLAILELQSKRGLFQNNRQLDMPLGLSHEPRFFSDICSMYKLEKLNLKGSKLRIDYDLAHLFQSCLKLSELHLETSAWLPSKLKMEEELKNHLRLGFQRLRLFELNCHFGSNAWPTIQEIVT
jgi:hypothetical protein